ncbi:unnamed protein product [Macrosiphum euphorbiae]|uniref:Uncharacterized protein n=1 Tax=Macrosiphum euphorbiae TaxID=13131 RepID=A0AAV0WCA5_9HEMI|nr:unnamed protein product [Macrosiphum euphorbiae]
MNADAAAPDAFRHRITMEILYKLDGDEAKGTCIKSDSATNSRGLLSFVCTVDDANSAFHPSIYRIKYNNILFRRSYGYIISVCRGVRAKAKGQGSCDLRT